MKAQRSNERKNELNVSQKSDSSYRKTGIKLKVKGGFIIKNLFKYTNSIVIVLVIMILFFSSSCTKDEGPIIIEPIDSTNNGVDPISFANDIQPIFNASCSSCHNETHDLDLRQDYAYDQLLTDGENAPYVDTENPEQSAIYIRPSTNMPPSGALQSFETNKILKWIEQGVLDN